MAGPLWFWLSRIYLGFFLLLLGGLRSGLARSGGAAPDLVFWFLGSSPAPPWGCLLLNHGSKSSAKVSGGLVFLSFGLSDFGPVGIVGRLPAGVLVTAERISLTVPSGKLASSAWGVYFLIRKRSISDQVEEVMK